MVSLSRREASERANRDQGDNNDVVVMGKQYKHRCRIYHDNPECSHLCTDTIVKLTRRVAQNNGYGPCKVCTLDTRNESSTGTQPIDLIETVRQKMAEDYPP
jgi:transcription elongation factor Elf1